MTAPTKLDWKRELPVNIELAVEKFQRAAGDTVGELNIRQTARYTGMQCEELAEKIELLSRNTSTEGLQLREFASLMDYVGKQFKAGTLDHVFGHVFANEDLRDKLADAEVDLAWVTFGSLHGQALDTPSVVREVAEKNLAKIGPDGLVLRDKDGKIAKPPGWVEPDHRPYLYPVPVAAGQPITPDAKATMAGYGAVMGDDKG